MLLFTYLIPILPIIFVFDGLVSIWRSRTPDHLAHLATLASMAVGLESGLGGAGRDGREQSGEKSTYGRSRAGSIRTRRSGAAGGGSHRDERSSQQEDPGELDWVWEFGTSRHTWPCGFMHWAVGRKDKGSDFDDPAERSFEITN